MTASPARQRAVYRYRAAGRDRPAARLVRAFPWRPDYLGERRRGDPRRAALAVAREATLADAYYQGYGPTAHVLPVMPVIAGAIMAVFGIDTPAGNVALLMWALAQTFVSYLLLARLFVALGMARDSVRWGLILLCLVPVFVPQEAVDFRFWDGALAVCFSAANLLLILRWRDGEFTLARMAGAGCWRHSRCSSAPPPGWA